MGFGTVKRLLVGRPMQSERLGHTLLPTPNMVTEPSPLRALRGSLLR